MRRWTTEALAELHLLAVWGVVTGDLPAFIAKHGCPYRTVVTRLQGMRVSHPRLTYEERMALLKGIKGRTFAEPKFSTCPRYGGPDWIGERADG